MVRIAILFAMLLHGAIPDAAAGQGGRRVLMDIIEPTDARAQLVTGLARALLAADSAVAATYVLGHAAPSADRDSLIQQTAMMLAAVHALESVAPSEIMASVEEENQVVSIRLEGGSGPGLALLLEIAGDPHRIVRIRRGIAPPPRPAPDAFNTFGELHELLEQRARADRFSGVVLAARGSEILHRGAYGMADRDRGRAVDHDTRFNLGSGNKQFTAIAVLRLVQEGRVQLDAPVGRYVQGLAPAVAEQVTIRHLLQHRSGLGDYLRSDAYNRARDRDWTTSELLDLFRAEAPAFAPGTRRVYSNSGYILLGAVVESVTGQLYTDVLRDWVYEPAGMTRTGAGGPGQVENTAIGYGEMGGRISSNESFRPRPSAAGGHYSTAADLLRFVQALSENRLLQPAYTELLLNEFSDERQPGTARRFRLGGGLGGISVAVRANLDTDDTVIILANRSMPIADDLANAVVERILER
jgi:D-alanyl-D-alanine carboxypeptidase